MCNICRRTVQLGLPALPVICLFSKHIYKFIVPIQSSCKKIKLHSNKYNVKIQKQRIGSRLDSGILRN